VDVTSIFPATTAASVEAAPKSGTVPEGVFQAFIASLAGGIPLEAPAKALAAAVTAQENPTAIGGEVPKAKTGKPEQAETEPNEQLNELIAEALGIKLTAIPEALDGKDQNEGKSAAQAASVPAPSVSAESAPPTPQFPIARPARAPFVQRQQPAVKQAAQPVLSASEVDAAANAAQIGLPHRSRSQAAETAQPKQSSAEGSANPVPQRAQTIIHRIESVLRKAGVDDKTISAVRSAVEKFETAPARTEVHKAEKISQIVEAVLNHASEPMRTRAIAAIQKLNPATKTEASESVSATPAAENDSPKPQIVQGQSALLQNEYHDQSDDANRPPEKTAPVEPTAQSAAVRNLLHPQTSAVERRMEAPSAPADLDALSVAERVVACVREMQDGEKPQTISVRLDPPELGSLDVTVRTVGTRVETRIVASNPDLRGWLETNRNDLAAALSKSGLELGSMFVGADSRGSNSSFQQHQMMRAPVWRPETFSQSPLVSQTPISWQSSNFDYSA